MQYKVIDTPIGPLRLVEQNGAVHRIDFGAPAAPADWSPVQSLESGVEDQLVEYFAGQRKSFDLRLSPRGTDFQLKVWEELKKIPFGETTSYGEIARRIGKPTASRAVGAANGKNPIPIVVPCHRVVGADGRLTGFGGGLPIKSALLQLESDPS